MSYGAFLVVLVVGPTLVAAGALRRHIGRRQVLAAIVVATMALFYTTLWDDALIAQGVWSYPADRVLGPAIGRVPLEECAFYIAQVVLVGVVWMWSGRWRRSATCSDS